MPDPPPPPSSGIFGRKASIFSRKKSTATPTSPPIVKEEEEEPPPPPITTITTSPERKNGHLRDSSVISLPASVHDIGNSVRRSVSLRSHKSQSSGSYNPRHTARSPSLGFTRSPSNHRTSRSVSASATAALNSLLSPSHSTSPAKSKSTDDDSVLGQSPKTRTYPHPITGDPPPKTPFSMLAGLKRQDSERPPLTSHGSTYSNFPLLPSTVGQMSHAPGGAAVAPSVGGQYTPAAIHHHIHETSTKRMATLDYLRKLHEGHIFYFSTLSYTPASLSHLPSMQPSKLGRRATNYFILGTSIPPLLDLNSGNPLDYLRAFAALLAEFDTYQQLNESGASAGLTRNRMGAMFNRGMRGVKGRRSSAATDSLLADLGSLNASTSAFPSVPGQAGEAGQDFLYLQTPSLPFDPDFSTSFATLADILVDAYAGILQLLPSPERCVPAVAEAFAKADKAVRKILIQGLMKEFEDGARKEVKGEVGGLGKVVLGGLM